MKRSHTVAFALVAAYLAVSLAPVSVVAASGNLAVGSSHTTETDFNNAQTLENVRVRGTGSTAHVDWDPAITESFEDGDIAEYQGDGGGFTVQSTDVYQGSYALDASSTTSQKVISDTDQKVSAGNTYEYWVKPGSGFAGAARVATQTETNAPHGYILTTRPKSVGGDSDMRLAVENSSGTTVLAEGGDLDAQAGTWIRVKFEWSSNGDMTFTAYDGSGNQIHSISGTDSQFSSGGIGWQVYDGSATFDNFGDAHIGPGTYVSASHDVSNAEQAWANVTVNSANATIQWEGYDGVAWKTVNSTTVASSGNYTLDISGTSYESWRVNVTFDGDGSGTSGELDDEGIKFDARIPDADGANASPQGGKSFNDEDVTLSVPVTDPDFGTAQGDSVDVTFFVDGAAVSTKTVTANQTVSTTATGIGDGDHTWHVELADSYGETATAGNWNFTVNHYPPVFDNSSASPAGGEAVGTDPVTLSIPVNDTDFAETSGDSVTVEFFVDGSKVGEDIRTSNGTASYDLSSINGGNHTWHAEATDEYGFKSPSDTFSFKTPDELRIYNESNHTALVNNAEATIEFYFGNGTSSTTETRTTTDGTVDMTGLPVDEQFIAVVDAQGYHSRRIYVESLFETQRVYVLNETQATTNTEFTLTDYTGRYPDATTVLEIQRVINGSWQTVEGDYFGATGGFPTTLATGERHQLVLTNTETGQSQPLGTFTPKGDSTQDITVFSDGSIQLEDAGVNVQVEPGLRRLDSAENQNLTTTIRTDSGTLDEWSVQVIYENATTGMNTTLAQTTNQSESGGTFRSSHNLTSKQGRVIVNVTYTMSGGTTQSEYITYQITKVFENEYGLLPVMDSVKSSYPEQNQGTVTALLSVIVTVLIAGGVARIPGTSTEVIGLAAILPLAGFGVLGWIGYGPIFAGAAAWVGMSALKRGI